MPHNRIGGVENPRANTGILEPEGKNDKFQRGVANCRQRNLDDHEFSKPATGRAQRQKSQEESIGA